MNFEIALNYWEIFLLILVRVASFVYTAPFFGTSGVPQRTKLGLAVFLSILIFMIIPDRTLEYSGILDYATLVVKESIVGLLLGFVCNLCVQTIIFAGHIIDMNVGLSMASMFDPATKTQQTVSGTFYYYCVMLLMLVSGLYQFLLTAITDTYAVIPIGDMTVNLSLYDSVVEILADYFIVGFRIALPVFVAVMLVNAILGILTKVASQLNMFAVGIQMKLLIGLGIMFLTVEMLPSVSTFIMNMMEQAAKSVVGGLS